MKSFKSHFNEAKDTHCSDECCGADVKAADCDCPADCPHCNCNAVSEGSIKGSGTDRKAVLKKAYRSGEQDTRQFNTPGGAATNKPKRGSDATVKKAYQAGRDSEHGDSAYKGKRRSKPQDTLGYKKPSYNEAIEEGILDNIKKKANDIRRKVVGPSQAEKDAARKKQMAKQHDSTMARIGSAMSAVAKKDKAAEVARLKQGLKNVQNKRNEETEQLDELSPETLKSYKKKALKQYKQSANKRNPGGGDYGSATKAAQDKHQKRFDKRHKGIGSEIKRTTDSDIHLKDPKGLVRKDPKSNSMTGKPAPYKNRAESKVDEVLDTPKAMDSYRDKAKYSKDKATNSAVANILRKGDHSADLKTRAKREKGLKMADRNATKKTVKALRGESIEEKNGLWANIHAKRARGEKMRKKGEEGAPTPEAIKRAQESFSEDLDAIMSNLDMVNEVAGAGEQGTPELTKKYKKDTPMEDKK